MRVKVGDQWFEVRVDQPIMFELTDADRENIAAMPPEATRYAIFHDDDPRSRDEQFEWMTSDRRAEDGQ